MPWWQTVLVLVPLTLVFVGGLVGGLIGGVAASACATLARRDRNAVLNAVSMVCVCAVAFGGYFGVIALLRPAAASPPAAPAAQQPSSCVTADRSGSASPATPAASVPRLPAGVEPISAPANSGTTSAHADEILFRSGNGDNIGEGQSADYTGADIDFSGTLGEVRIAAGPYLIELEPPHGENFVCGTYAGATQYNLGATPDISVTGGSRGCNNDNGTFTIYQIASRHGALTRLNATFSQTCDASPAPLVGLIRYNATTPTPIPTLPSSAQRITPPANSGTTSAHSDEFSVLSASGDTVGGGQPFDYVGPGIRVGGTSGTVDVDVEGWSVVLSARNGEQLVPGTYPAAARPSSATAPGISVSKDSGGCGNDYGTFTIYQIATSTTGDITRLNATFSQKCEWTTAPPLVGFIRFNATTPTPVPVLPASAT